jgi:signal transduction histidine kinase
MGIAELLRAFDASAPGVWTLAALFLCASVGLLTTHSALMDLDDAVTSGHAHLETLVSALDRASTVATRHEAWREEMTHDACNALAGLRGALQTLERYDGRLDESTTGKLRTAAIREVHHLEHLIVAAKDQPTRDFDVADVLGMVVETRRAQGTHIEVYGGGHLHAHGRPDDLATALQNLLVNAEVHAPGSPVVIRVAGTPEAVEVLVSDWGPGLTDDEAEQAFDRGARGQASPGTGLGLHIARSVMRDQGGDLELRSRRDGATFVLTVPAATPSPPELRPVDAPVIPRAAVVPGQRFGASTALARLRAQM